MSQTLSLAELESFDPSPKSFGNEKRFLCPFCGDGKPRDAAHKSLSANSVSGAWICHRCNGKGLLKEFWTKQSDWKSNKPRVDPLKALKDKLAARKEPPKRDVEPNDKLDDKLAKYPEYVAAFDSSPAAKYLLSRGISESVAKTAGCGYAAKWEHWEKDGDTGEWKYSCHRRVVFPIKDERGNLVAIQARAIDKVSDDLKVRNAGQKSKGVFSTTGSIEIEVPLTTEAPIDALSIAQAGYSAFATCGTSWPDWFTRHCAFKLVPTAYDADERGDLAAEKLAVELKKNGARPIRLRPEGGKDWNEVLINKGVEAIKAQVKVVMDGMNFSHSTDVVMLEETEVCLGGSFSKTSTDEQISRLLTEARQFVEEGLHSQLPFKICSGTSLEQVDPKRWLPTFLSDVSSSNLKERERAIKELCEIMLAVKQHLSEQRGLSV